MTFKREEKDLKEFRDQLEAVPIPHSLLDGAIEKGIQRAEESDPSIVRKRKQKWTISKWGWAAVILFLAGCVWTVYLIDPAFLRGHPSWETAMENEYYHEINYTEEKNGISLTLHGVIMDEGNIVSFITIETEEKVPFTSIGSIQLLDEHQENLLSHVSYGPVEEDDGKWRKVFRHTVDTRIEASTISEKGLSLEFDVYVNGEEGLDEKETFNVPIPVEQIELAEKQVFTVDETVDIEGQKIQIEKVDMYPTRAEVHLSQNEGNEKDILDYTDLKLVDGKGNVWGKLTNGVVNVSNGENAGKEILYLESSYFHMPEELYLVMNRAQAVNKDEREIIYSLDESEIIQAPDDGKLIESVYEEEGQLIFVIQHPDGEEFPYGIFSYILDDKGEEIELYSSSSSSPQNDGKGYYGLEIKNMDELKGNIHIPLQYYPTFIEAEEEIKIQIK